MRYKLIAVDIDGTLVNSRSELTPRTRSAIQKALDAGVIFTISTGRPMRGVEWLNVLLPCDLPFITYNGAAVVMGKSKKVLLHQALPYELSREALTLGVKNDTGTFAWVDDVLYAATQNAKNEIYKRISGYEPIIQQDMDSLLQNGASKILWCDSADKIGRLQDEMQEHFAGKLNCHTSSPMLLEFVDLAASKANAMAKIGELYGIDASEMIAVGDGFNDISMLEYAGLGVAMANAPQAVKDRADFITLSNDDDGVAYVIEKFFNEEDH